MPTYEYRCQSCQHRFDLRQSFDSEPVATCPECQSQAARQFVPVPIMFKGDGWTRGNGGGSPATTPVSDEPGAIAEAKTKDDKDKADKLYDRFDKTKSTQI